MVIGSVAQWLSTRLTLLRSQVQISEKDWFILSGQMHLTPSLLAIAIYNN